MCASTPYPSQSRYCDMTCYAPNASDLVCLFYSRFPAQGLILIEARQSARASSKGFHRNPRWPSFFSEKCVTRCPGRASRNSPMRSPVSHGADEAIPAWRMRAPNMNLRVVEIDGEPWFPAKDVCIAVGIAHLGSAVRTLDGDECNTVAFSDGKRGNPNKTVISESGLYALVMRSNKPIAREFRKWVTSEVLPSIRKYGMYMTQEVAREAVEDPMFLMARALMVANERLGNRDDARRGRSWPSLYRCSSAFRLGIPVANAQRLCASVPLKLTDFRNGG